MQYGFHHHTNSPHHPSANGEAERAVCTVKSLLEKADDPYLALLAYTHRCAPLSNGYFPAELLFGRKLRSRIPTKTSLLKPSLPVSSKVRNFEKRQKEKQSKNFNSRHKTKKLPVLSPGEIVFVRD